MLWGTIRSLAFAVILSVIGAGSANAKIFGSSEVGSSDVNDFKKWNNVVTRYTDEEQQNEPVLATWHNEIKNFENEGQPAQIKLVNDYINNKIKYKKDSKNWGMSDYWASPLESFTLGQGDCEDYAIAKFFSLKQLGFDESQMRIVVLRDTKKNEIHAVLSVNHDGKNYILDNQYGRVKQDTEIAFYQPIYSINTHYWWKHSYDVALNM